MTIKMYHLPGEVIIAKEISIIGDSIEIEKPLAALTNPMEGGLLLSQPIWSAGTINNTYHINKLKLIQEPLILTKQLEDIYIKASSTISIPQEPKKIIV